MGLFWGYFGFGG